MVNRISKEEAAKQFAAADKRIKGISSIAQATIKRTKVLEVEKQYGTIKGNKQAVTSVDRALRSLTKSTQALAMGVKTITVETARGVKSITQTGASVIGEYTKALGEDLHIKREGMLVALTAKTTPLIGYAIAKLFETSVFKNMIERMKSGLNRALESVSSRFKRLASAGWEKSKEFWNSLRDKTSKKRGSINVQVKNAKKNQSGKTSTINNIESQVPHMAKGGYIQKDGLAKVHAAEIVQPVDKVVETIVDQVNKRLDSKEKKQKSFLTDNIFYRTKGKKKDLFGFEKVGTSIRNAFEVFTRSNLNLESQIIRRDKKDKQNLIKSFITAFTEEAKQEELPLMERQVQATIELKKTISGENRVARAAWNKMLYEHPVFHAIYGFSKAFTKTLITPVKFLFKKRGIYANRLSNRGTVFERLLDAMTNVYTGLMGKMDSIIGNTYISASATAKAQNGKAQGLTKAPKQSGYTIIGKGAKLLGKVGKMGLGVASKVGKWTFGSKMTQEEWDKKVNLVAKVKDKYRSTKEKTKEFASRKAREFAREAGKKRDSLYNRGKEWWNIKNLDEQKQYDRKRDFEKNLKKVRKKIAKEKREEWIKEQKKKFSDKLEMYKKYANDKRAVDRRSRRKYKMDRSKWREGSIPTNNEQKKKWREYRENRRLKINKDEKDKTGRRTQFSIFKSIEKINKKNLKENIKQAKSSSKLTKFMTGWRKFLPFLKTIGGGIISILSGFMSMVGSGLTLLLGSLGIKWAVKPLLAKAGGAIFSAFKTGGKYAAKGAAKIGKAGLKTSVGKKIAASGVGLAVGAGAKKLSEKYAKRKAAKTLLKKTAVKGASKAGGKFGSKLIPGLGILAGSYFAAQRLLKGQFIEAGLELSSGIMGGTSIFSVGIGLGGMALAESALAYRDYQRSQGKYKKTSKKYKNLAETTVKKIKDIQMSTLDYLPIFAGFTGSATAMVTASYLNRYGVNNPDALVKAANKISGISKKAWIEGGGNAAVHAGAIEISRSKRKIIKLWDKNKGIFDETASSISGAYNKITKSKAVGKAKTMYEKGMNYSKKYGKKFYNQTKEKSSELYSGFKKKAFDIADDLPGVMSKLSDNIVNSFIKFGNFLGKSIGDPVEHYKNMKDKVFGGITRARTSLSLLYSKLHDIFELLKTELIWKKAQLQFGKIKQKVGFPDFDIPNFIQPSAMISAGAGIGVNFEKDSSFILGKGHKGETGVLGGDGINFITPDKVREGLFGGLGISSKQVAQMSANPKIYESKQNSELKNSMENMKNSVENTAKNNAGMMSAMIDKSLKISNSTTSSNTINNSGGNGGMSNRDRDPSISQILGGRIT